VAVRHRDRDARQGEGSLKGSLQTHSCRGKSEQWRAQQAAVTFFLILQVPSGPVAAEANEAGMKPREAEEEGVEEGVEEGMEEGARERECASLRRNRRRRDRAKKAREARHQQEQPGSSGERQDDEGEKKADADAVRAGGQGPAVSSVVGFYSFIDLLIDSFDHYLLMSEEAKAPFLGCHVTHSDRQVEEEGPPADVGSGVDDAAEEEGYREESDDQEAPAALVG
jgi:hypothetical protein